MRDSITSIPIINSLEHVIIINAYVPNYRASKYMKQKQLKGRIDIFSVTA